MDKPAGYEWTEVSMKFDADVNEMIKLLKKKYQTQRMSDALRLFFKENEPEIHDDGQKHYSHVHGYLNGRGVPEMNSAMKEIVYGPIINSLKGLISEENIEIVFSENKGEITRLSSGVDEFYKIDESRHNLESTGLGLAICKKILHILGGKIWVESEGINKGSTFYFTLKTNYSK